MMYTVQETIRHGESFHNEYDYRNSETQNWMVQSTRYEPWPTDSSNVGSFSYKCRFTSNTAG